MKKIRLLLATLLLLAGNVLMAQTLRVTGIVTDATDGAPVIGAAVKVLGTTTGVVTDFNGTYTISVASGATLEFSYIGMVTQTVKIGNQTVVNVTLQQDALQLEDVMVVAYATVKKSSYTGSAAVVKKEQIERIQSTNVTKSLAGAVPGVQVVGASGQPGSSASIRIRGIGSINASSNPLYVVDGAAFDG
ncbi:MAG: btuB 7, partial [Bacteroidetes bacterium]|nr:btuB 7 [Bacteroidota bacterium]